jgi:hypothetical protein
MPRSSRTWLSLSLLTVIAVGAHWCREFWLVDKCLDAGYVYDYVRGVCDHNGGGSPPIPYATRHSVLLSVGVIVAIGGIIAAVVAGRRGEVGEPALPAQSFALFMTLAIMMLAVWALPIGARPILGAAILLGVIWAGVRLAGQRKSRG